MLRPVRSGGSQRTRLVHQSGRGRSSRDHAGRRGPVGCSGRAFWALCYPHGRAARTAIRGRPMGTGSEKRRYECRLDLIEFWIEDQGDALVSLRVRESGFSWAGLTDEQRRDVLEGNAEGWQAALEAARSFLEHP
jgi:hypothetical protein